jgi:hypothetical protein
MKPRRSQAKYLVVLWSVALIGTYVLYAGGTFSPSIKSGRVISAEPVSSDPKLNLNVPATQAATEPSKTVLWGSKSGIVVEPERLQPPAVLPSSKSAAVVLPGQVPTKEIQPIPASGGKLEIIPSTTPAPAPAQAPATQP